MTCKDLIVLFALFAIAAAVKQELRHPPHHHGYHHHGPVPNHIDPEAPSAVEQPLPVQEENVEDDQNDLEAVIEDELEGARKVSLKSRQEETEGETEIEEDQIKLEKKVAWVDCDYTLNPGKSCYDCQTRLICKNPGGGKLIGCNYALKPYCNNGICTAVPSAGCA